MRGRETSMCLSLLRAPTGDLTGALDLQSNWLHFDPQAATQPLSHSSQDIFLDILFKMRHNRRSTLIVYEELCTQKSSKSTLIIEMESHRLGHVKRLLTVTQVRRRFLLVT